MKRLLLAGLLGLSGFLAPIHPAQAQLGIRPASIEVDLDQIRPTGTFTITNETDAETRVRVMAQDFSFNESGSLQATNETPFSLAGMIKFNPREFTLPPQASRAVRFSIVNNKKLEDGEYWAALSFEPLVPNEIVQDRGDGNTMKLNLITATLVPIYGQVGKVEHSADLQGFKALTTEDGIELQASLVNTGTGYLLAEGSYQVLDASGEILSEGVIGRDVILRKNRLNIRHTIDNPSEDGKARVKLSIRFRQLEEPLTAEAELSRDVSSGE